MHAQYESRSRNVHRTKQWRYPFSYGSKKVFDRLPTIDFLKFFIAYGITGLSYSENSNGYNSAHIRRIWMNDLPLDSLREGLSNDVVFVPGQGSWPGSGLNYPVVARSKIFCCHRIEHPKKSGKRILHH